MSDLDNESKTPPTPQEVGDQSSNESKTYYAKDYVANVDVSESVFKVMDGEKIQGPKLSLLYTNLTGFTDFVNRMGEAKITYSTNWGDAVSDATGLNVLHDDLEGLMKRDADWAQYVEVDGSKLRAGRPGIAKSAQGNVLVGQQAISRITALTSVGTIVKIPLWHTGIWVSIKAPQLSAWVELERRVAMEKVLAGRNTRGLVFSNDSVFMVSHVVDFILNHIFDSTLQNWNVDALRKTIRTPDLAYLATGMALTVFPDGHPHSQPCTSDAGVCQHVTQGIVNLAKLMWVDRASLTDAQRKHMLKRDKAHTLAEITAYQDQWAEAKEQAVVISDALRVVYRIPSLDEYIEMGTTWINRIEAATESAFGANLRGQQREEYLIAQTQATRVSLYVHWIDRFVITEDDSEQIVEDRDTIEEVVTQISGSTEVSDKIIAGAKAFINKRTISCIGIPNYECPSCKSWHLTEEGPMKAIIPIDAVATFFTLVQSLLMSKLLRQGQ